MDLLYFIVFDWGIEDVWYMESVFFRIEVLVVLFFIEIIFIGFFLFIFLILEKLFLVLFCNNLGNFLFSFELVYFVEEFLEFLCVVFDVIVNFLLLYGNLDICFLIGVIMFLSIELI